MKNEKWYEFHWKDGRVTYARGCNVSTAAGININGLAALDYYKEADKIPNELKDIVFVRADGGFGLVSKETLFGEQIADAVNGGKQRVTVRVCKHAWDCSIQINRFEIIVNEI